MINEDKINVVAACLSSLSYILSAEEQCRQTIAWAENMPIRLVRCSGEALFGISCREWWREKGAFLGLKERKWNEFHYLITVHAELTETRQWRMKKLSFRHLSFLYSGVDYICSGVSSVPLHLSEALKLSLDWGLLNTTFFIRCPNLFASRADVNKRWQLWMLTYHVVFPHGAFLNDWFLMRKQGRLSHLPEHKIFSAIFLLQDMQRLWRNYCGFKTRVTVTFLFVKAIDYLTGIFMAIAQWKAEDQGLHFKFILRRSSHLYPADISRKAWYLDLHEKNVVEG